LRSPHQNLLGTQNLPLFIASGLLLNLIPGPDTLYIVGRSISQGRKAGVVSVLGISSGCVVHTIAAAFGLSAIMAASASAFAVVKCAGAAYLAYLGVRLFLDRTVAATTTRGFSAQELGAIYRQGVLTNVLNPKVALFFLSFLPQFVDPASHMKVVAFLFLGGVFIFNAMIYCSLVAWFASAISSRLRDDSSASSLMKRATGALFVVLGLKLAATN
jgi:threonine/homoserine/homoserine lactone efflux protein